MSDSIDMPPGVEVALRTALGRVYDAGRKPDARARETAITYAVDQVTHAWLLARLAQQPKAAE